MLGACYDTATKGVRNDAEGGHGGGRADKRMEGGGGGGLLTGRTCNAERGVGNSDTRFFGLKEEQHGALTPFDARSIVH